MFIDSMGVLGFDAGSSVLGCHTLSAVQSSSHEL